MDILIVAALIWVGWQLAMIVQVLRSKIVPTSFNEALPGEEGGVNEPEPRHKI